MNKEKALEEALNTTLNVAWDFAELLEPFAKKDEITSVKFHRLLDKLKELDPLINPQAA